MSLRDKIFWKQRYFREIEETQEKTLKALDVITRMLETKLAKENNLKAIILDMKMSATNALSEIWLSDPKHTIEEQNTLMIEALKIIQARGLDI